MAVAIDPAGVDRRGGWDGPVVDARTSPAASTRPGKVGVHSRGSPPTERWRWHVAQWVVWDATTGKRDAAADPTWTRRRVDTATAVDAPIRSLYPSDSSIRVVDDAPPTPEERALWRVSARPDAAWHRSEAARFEGLARPAAALVHLDILLAMFPEDMALARRRAAALAGLADPAAARSVSAAARGALLAGDEAEYRTHRTALLAAFAKSSDREVVAAAARACALAPGNEPGLASLADAAKIPGRFDDRDWTAGWMMRGTDRPADAKTCFHRAAPR